MAKGKFEDFFNKREEVGKFAVDVADEAFWDEFWSQENKRYEEDEPLVTITITNQDTGEEKIIENVRLRFKSMKKLRG